MPRPSLAVLKARKRARDAGITPENLDTLSNDGKKVNKVTKVTKDVTLAAIALPALKNPALFGEYGSLETLLAELEETNAERKRGKKSERPVNNQIAFERFKPVIQLWIDNKVIPDKQVFASTAYFAVDCGEYEFLIAMCDLAVELKVGDFSPYLKRDLQAFICDEIWELCKKYYWHWPDGNARNGEKFAQKALPEWFWTIFDRVVINQTWPTTKDLHKIRMMLHIAAYDLEFQGKPEQALNYALQCNETLSLLVREGTSGVSRLIKRLKAKMNSSSDEGS